MVEKIAKGDPGALETLWQGFAGIRKLLVRKWGRNDVEDMLHDTFVETVIAIRRGLRDPECVWGLARKVALSKVAQRFARTAAEQTDGRLPTSERRDGRLNPEQRLLSDEPIRVALNCLSKPDREILTRFYLNEENAAVICADLDMSPTRFRNAKNRALGRLGKAGKALHLAASA